MNNCTDTQNNKYKIAIFDFDGTLIDTIQIYPLIHRELLRDFGVSEKECSYLTPEYWQHEIYDKNEHIDIVNMLIQKHHLEDKTDELDFRTRRNNIEIEYFRGERNIKGLKPLSSYIIRPIYNEFVHLYNNRTQCYIVSHNYGTIVDAAMQSLELSDYITDCFTHCLYDELKHEKYDRNEKKEDSFARLIEVAIQDGYTAQDCIVYDDLLVHISNAQKLGMKTVLVSNTQQNNKNTKHLKY